MSRQRSRPPSSPCLPWLLLAPLLLAPAPARAGFTETLPQGVFLLEGAYYHSTLDRAYDDAGNVRPIIDEIPRYEPGGGKQGVIRPEAEVDFRIMVWLLQYGLLDWLSIGVGVPVVMASEVQPNLGWEPGDHQPALGHPYSEEEFWQWAASMDQPKPGSWSRDEPTLSDVVCGLRYRFSEHLPSLQGSGFAMALHAAYALPTGEPPDPEEVVAAGTTSWDLHSQGELQLHLAAEQTFGESLDGRLTLGLDLFYEAFLEREYTTPTGKKHPLLLNQEDYAGPTYTLDPGDFWGAAVQATVVPWKGPLLATWLSRGGSPAARGFPPLLSLSLLYRHTRIGQSDWNSRSPLWDWQHEMSWRPGYKNILEGRITLSLLRIGAPLQLYLGYRDQQLIGGKNSRPSNVLSAGLQLLARLW
ncbi:MAG: hypothetical protein FJ125_03945 [Deltaproteobacteria bacterium]|nr:hypothetical protein [Deltaproteobacteria bacterium]